MRCRHDFKITNSICLQLLWLFFFLLQGLLQSTNFSCYHGMGSHVPIKSSILPHTADILHLFAASKQSISRTRFTAVVTQSLPLTLRFGTRTDRPKLSTTFIQVAKFVPPSENIPDNITYIKRPKTVNYIVSACADKGLVRLILE